MHIQTDSNLITEQKNRPRCDDLKPHIIREEQYKTTHIHTHSSLSRSVLSSSECVSLIAHTHTHTHTHTERPALMKASV